MGHSEPCFSVSTQHQYLVLITKGRYLRTDAWHVVTSTDSLADSDEELMDECRNDYSKYLEESLRHNLLMIIVDQRIAVIARLRGRAPTPPPDIVAPTNNISDTREHRWRTVQSWR